MTDSSSLIQNQVAVSSDALYTLKPSSVRARAYRASIPTSSKPDANPTETSIFFIPGGRRNCYLDPQQTYLRFTVINNDTSGNKVFYTDGTAASFINRIDTFHGSAMLETIQQYNVLFNYLVDFQFTASAKAGFSSIYGTGKTADTARQGLPLYGNDTLGSGQRMTFCMPILSSLFGLGADKLLPIGQLIDDIRIELTWESQLLAAFYAATGTANTSWKILNAELELCIIELSDEGQSIVENVSPFTQPVFFHGNSWRHMVSTLPSGTTGQVSYLVPSRQASLKTLICLPRRATETGAANGISYAISSRINPDFATYWWRIGSYMVPNKPVTIFNNNNTGGYSEAFAEVLRSFHALNAPQYIAGISTDYYNVMDADGDAKVGGGTSAIVGGVIAGPTGSNSYKNAFAIAQELESFANRSDLLISGMNTLSTNIFFEATIQATGPAVNYTLDFYSNFDVIYILENGLLQVKF